MISSAIRSVLIAGFLLVVFGFGARSAPSEQKSLSSGELDQLVAPIALYPDPLLSEVLMAATYPLQIVQAERWLSANKNLKGNALKDAVGKNSWDDSVKSLAATPTVLEMMSSKIDWTQKLGTAVVDQQSDVMDAIQRLRAKAQANNKLQSTKQQTVTIRQEQGRQVIAIEPTDPDTVYVPYYDPAVVYGSWSYPAYPPYYWPAPGYIAAGIIATGIAFGAGYALGRWASGGYWGGNVNWNNNNITINRPGGGNGANWNRGAHVEHRLGNRGGGNEGLNFRGRNGQQVVRPGGGHANLGERHRPSQRPNAGNRGGRNHAQARPARGGAARHQAATRNRGGGAAGHFNRSGGSLGGAGIRHHAGGGFRAHGGGGFRGGGGGGFRGGGGGGFRGGGGRGGGRRSDIRLKHDIVFLGRLDDALGFYRFRYYGSNKEYVGVMAQEVQQVTPRAVFSGDDGYLRVNYRALGLTFQTYDSWIQSGARVPVGTRVARRN